MVTTLVMIQSSQIAPRLIRSKLRPAQSTKATALPSPGRKRGSVKKWLQFGEKATKVNDSNKIAYFLGNSSKNSDLQNECVSGLRLGCVVDFHTTLLIMPFPTYGNVVIILMDFSPDYSQYLEFWIRTSIFANGFVFVTALIF